MLDIPAKTVYVDPAVRAKANCRERLERLLPHVRCDDVRDLDPETYAELWRMRKRRHGKDDFGDDAIVAFTDFDPDRLGWYYHLRDGGRMIRERGEYCQTALELNLVDGCVFRCAYCGFGRRVMVSLDVERFVAGLDEQFARHPDQALWKFSNMTDLPPFEPELDAVAPVVERFAREPGRYVMLFTKSDNVDFLLGLDHGGHTIISWSMSGPTQSRLIDQRAATMAERVEAMAKCQGAGYLVRARLSPIVPVRGWRAELRELFETMLAAARPDIVTLELLGWFDFDDLPELMDLDLLDPDAVESARAAADDLRGCHSGPFTEATHQEIYRFCVETVQELSPGTPVAACHGTPATWKMLEPLVGMTGERYICNCGPSSAPGDPLYDQANARLAEP
ncbi:MAG: spore photoproduct lyase family protein [Planctomycetota bacterium]